MKIGLDLGTSTTLVAVLDTMGKPCSLISKDNKNQFFTPSVVHISKNMAYIGQFALDILENQPDIKLLQFFKRHFGKIDPLYFDDNGYPWHPEGIAALLLLKVVNDVKMEGYEVDGAVITVPAHFDEEQKNAVLDAAEMIQLPVLDLIEEPIAAAFHYDLQNNSSVTENILVYDLGGGTFDVTILKSGEKFEILAKEGLTDLGGKEFDDKIAEIIIEKFENFTDRKFDSLNSLELIKLRKISEKFKKILSIPGTDFHKQAVKLDGVSLEITILKEEFINAIDHLISRTIDVCKNCLKSIELASSKIDKVLLVGGGSMILNIKKRLKELFKASHQEILFHEPLKAVSYGAVLHANRLEDTINKITKSTLTEYNYGIKVYNSHKNKIDIQTIIKKNRSMPIQVSHTFYTHKKDQEFILFEISRYREHNLRLQESKVEVIGEYKFIITKKNYPIDLKMRLDGSGVLSIQAFSNKKAIHKAMDLNISAAAKPYLEEQKELVQKITIINQIH